ncbi:hypothetical protein QGM71_08775 [Virgibacillus sp. C22-A2]|uniref:Uncharacterized protein n=1 Tax=Virgibacillus tibetensis TaxID=3042313 RepID=A0ABU6KE32_9BACI|nr:hypothetical protein [Virgibacillus sp. C22-A2]
MSDEKPKQVIHVKDLVIKADNVHIQETERRRRYDPFLGRPRMRGDDLESASDDLSPDLDATESKDRTDRTDRRPFPWF